MVKHTKTIRRQIAKELFECVWPFLGLARKIAIKTANITGLRFKNFWYSQTVAKGSRTM